MTSPITHGTEKSSTLVPLPAQPAGVSWPTLTWATAEPDGANVDELDDIMDRAFRINPNSKLALTTACIVVQHGRIVAERYGPGTGSQSTLISWSTAKSVTQALVGLAVADGLVDLDAAPAHPSWDNPDDPRRGITLTHLLQMRDGLDFNEDYVDAETSHCLEMLWGSGAGNMAEYAAGQPALHAPGTHFNYSSGTTNIIVDAVMRAYGATSPDDRRRVIDEVLVERLLSRINMSSAIPKLDASGGWVGSSYLYATARDFARFGYLYLRDGIWNGDRILPEGWADRARTPISTDPDGDLYGEQWWPSDDRYGTFSALGYEGQVISVVPALDVVIVRFGKTPSELSPDKERFITDLIECLGRTHS